MRPALVIGVVTTLAALGVGGVVAWQERSAPEPGTSVTPLEPMAVTPQVGVPRSKSSSRGQGRTVQLDAQWVARAAELTDIPVPAVTAYARATLTAPKGCELGWTTLAGIGWVESQHGTIDGRALGRDGRSSRPILGPALDGDSFAAIRATPRSTRMHGNPTWDHAIGPMQFIPSTWQRWARDGDGDGVADPHDIDDAAASAAAYLCHDRHDLTNVSGWNAAIYSYNHDNGYVVAVHAAANRYGLALG